MRDIDPDYVSGRVRLGDLYRRKDRFDSALTEYRAAVALDADAHRAYIGEAMIHINMQRTTEARAAVANARAALERAVAKSRDPRQRRGLAQDSQRIRQLEQQVGR